MASKKETKFDSEALGDNLRNLNGPELDDERKKRIKNNVMSQLEVPVIRYIRSLVSSLKLDASSRALIKEKVFDLLESKKQKHFYFSNVFRYHKKFVSVFLLFLTFFGMFSFVNFYSPGVVLAEEFTVLDAYRGDVCVERAGKELEVKKGMRIYQNDKISTGENGFASIKFFDDSISRLDEGTRVVINELFKPSDTSIESYVEISLLEGEMWSRVVNLVERESSFVVEANDVYTAAQRAAFNVRVIDSSIEIGVFDHMVNVSSADDNDEKGEKIVSGEKAFLNNEREVEVSEIDKSDKQIAWVKENLDSDKLYLLEVEERLFTARLENAGVDVDEDFEFGKSVVDEFSLFLTFDDINKKKKELDLAEKDFLAAEVKLNDPNISKEEKRKAEGALMAFSDSVKEFYKFADEVGYTDENYANELKRYAEDKVMSNKKSLSLVSPKSPSYEAKKVVENLELLGVENEVDLVKVKREHSLSKLSDAETALKNGDKDSAEVAIKEYREDLDEVVGIIETIDKEKSKDLVEEMKKEVSKDIELLENIDEISEADIDELKRDLSRISSEMSDIDADMDKAVDNTNDKVDESMESTVETTETSETSENTEVSSDDVVKDETVTGEDEEETLERASTYEVELEGDKPLSPLLY